MSEMFEKAFMQVAKKHPEAMKDLANVVAKALKDQKAEAKKAEKKMRTVRLTVETCDKKRVVSVSKIDLMLSKGSRILSVTWE
jgi:hypothetical protein